MYITYIYIYESIIYLLVYYLHYKCINYTNNKDNMKNLRIGVTGYLTQKFDTDKAERSIREAYDALESEFSYVTKSIISGLTDLGIPALAYREAKTRGWKTVGIACSKAREHICFPVDEKVIVGDEWGDESSTFLNNIDVLIRIGDGKQALRETDDAKALGKKVLEYDLK